MCFKFNRNMGCIEIGYYVCGQRGVWEFNRNMGCIEIAIQSGAFKDFLCLIETWDVLKYTVNDSRVRRIMV